MCWKHEWAMAINKLNSAIEHVERAQAKLEKRLERNKKCLEKLKDTPRYRSRFGKPYAKILAPTEKLIAHNTAGIEECQQVNADLRSRQDQLFRMVHVYGFKKTENPKRVYELMGNYRVPKAVLEGTTVIFQKKEAS